MQNNLFTRILQRLQPLREATGRWFNRRKATWQRFAEKYPRGSRIVKWGGLAALLGAFALLIFTLIVFLSVPTVRQLRQVQTQHASEIYSADGALLGRYFNENRTVIKYEDMPAHIFDALVATEDERFYRHGGIDFRSWGRVLFRTILRKDESGGGGSTISQQLAKNLFKRKNYKFLSLLINKAREIVIATRLERAYEKPQLLALYLNTVPFSENVFGIDVAARRFFSKAPSDLLVEEGAALIGTLRATTHYNPARFPDRVRERRNVVLRQMLKNDYITQSAFDSLQQLPLELCYDPVIKNDGIAPYFREYVRMELDRLLADHRKPNGQPYDLYADGLKIYTTLNTNIQRIAESAVQEHISYLQRNFDKQWQGQKPWVDDEVINTLMRASSRYEKYKKQGLSDDDIQKRFEEKIPMTVFSWEGDKDVEMSPLDSIRYYFCLMQVGFLAAEPRSGFIRAWVGGIDFNYFQFDHVRARRQSGSAFKPIVYTQALRSGIPPCEQIPNELKIYHQYEDGEWSVKEYGREDPTPHISPEGKDEDDWIPQNSDGIYGGSYSMEGALTNSVNTITVNLIMRVGYQSVIDLARRMGITSEKMPPEPTLALGTGEVSVYEMVSAFSIFANRGLRVPLTVISRIETYDGKVLVSFDQPKPERVISEEHADMITEMLQSVASYGTAARLRWKYGLHHPLAIAGKTGTSQNHSDGWFVGFTPMLVAGVWVGGDSPLVRFRHFEYGQGAATALPVWGIFMRKLLDDPRFSAWEEATFPVLSEALQDSLQCPHRIKSAAEILADSILADSLSRIELLPGEELAPVEGFEQN
jgi:penicillin-binding protein 1A